MNVIIPGLSHAGSQKANSYQIYQENLGPKTAALAKAMTRYEPDNSWSLVKGQ